MELLILRHGEASHDVEPDGERPLTARGREQTRAVLDSRARELAGIDLVITSPLRRARETAALALPFTAPGARLLVSELLVPEGSPDALLAFLAGQSPQQCLLVGHQPLAGALIGVMTGRATAPPHVVTSGLACLEVFAWCGDGARELWLQQP